MSGHRDVEALLAFIKKLPKDATLSDALSRLREAEPASLTETRRRCALVRGFDAHLFTFLTRGVKKAPSLEEFVATRGVRRLDSVRWALDETTRAALLQAWQSRSLSTWKSWNKRLGDYFVKRERVDERLDALYHLAAAPRPERAASYFRDWYAEADAVMDLAQCHALLEILRVQEFARGEKLSELRREYRQYYRARVLFNDDYYKTGSYFPRAGLLEAFEKVLLEPNRWIFHIHATGGSGKTMFLRWLIAHYLLPKRIPTARVDLDEAKYWNVLDNPVELFARVVEQWSVQVPGTGLTSLLEKLNRELTGPGWNVSVPAEVGRQLRGARLKTPLVVILDTLEDVTLSREAWLAECVESLRHLRTHHRDLLVILSGRYDIAKHTSVFVEGEYLSYELRRFSEAEAHGYLESRGIPQGPTRNAIVQRAGDDESVDDADRLTGRNPFKLAMFAELVLNRPDMEPKDVWNLPRVDVAYLLERVVRRIPSQSLRWAIRYGAITRHLTINFVEAVLLPPLRQALRGEAADHPNRDLPQEFRDTWEEDRALADALTAFEIWAQLRAYARERGWISLVGSGSSEELRFHPDVINPTRLLLRDQAVFRELQQRAVEFFELRAALDQYDAVMPTREELAARNACEAVFHKFQLDGPGAVAYWRDMIRRAERFGALAAATVAAEITGGDYATQHREPLKGISTLEILAAAHCEAADLLVQASGLAFGAEHELFARFTAHVENANHIEHTYGEPCVPAYLSLLRDGAQTEPTRATKLLRDGIAQVTNSHERAMLLASLARQFRRVSPRQAVEWYLELLRLLPDAERTGLREFDVAMTIAELWQEIGDHEAVVEAFRLAASLAGDTGSIAALHYREAMYSLEVWDLESAERVINALIATPIQSYPRASSWALLRIRLMLAQGDALRAADAASGSQGATLIERAQLLDQLGVARAMLLDFNSAFDAWEQAASAYDRARSPTGATRCAFLAVRLKATACGNVNDAVTQANDALRLPGMRDVELYSEFQLLRAYIAYRGERTEEARGIFDKVASANDQEFSAPLRARVLLFGLIFGLARTDAAYLSRMFGAIEAVRPRKARAMLLSWCEHSEETANLDPPVRERLISLFGAELPEVHEPIEAHIGRVHLLRVLEERKRAAGYLSLLAEMIGGRSGPVRLLQSWYLNRARLRLGEQTTFANLLPMAEKEKLGDSPLRDALRIEAALEACREGNRTVALDNAKVGLPFEALKGQGRTIWYKRIEEVEAYAWRGEPVGSVAQSVARFYKELGDLVGARVVRMKIPVADLGAFDRSIQNPAPVAPMWRGVSSLSGLGRRRVTPTLSFGPQEVPPLISQAATSNEVAIDLLMGDWRSIAKEMAQCLRPMSGGAEGRDRFALDVPSELSSLPWELAPIGPRFWRTSSLARRADPIRDRDPTTRILLMRSEMGIDDSNESLSGSNVEHLYAAHKHVRYEVLYNPLPNDVDRTIGSLKPHVIHVSAAMREGSGGTYLDFESTESRADIRQGKKKRFIFELFWSATRLVRDALKSEQPITLILDIAGTQNLAETVRMLLLRNLFAANLFQLGSFQAVLAVGLADPAERASIAELLVGGLMREGAWGAFNSLRTAVNLELGQSDLRAALPRLGAALWTLDPYLPVRLPAP